MLMILLKISSSKKIKTLSSFFLDTCQKSAIIEHVLNSSAISPK